MCNTGFVRIDVHQHLWTERLCVALAARERPPRLRRPARGQAGWVLELAGEPPFALSGAPDDPARRAAQLEGFGVDAAVVALSSALGVEGLPADEAHALISAWDDDSDELPPALTAWGALPLAEPDPDDVDAALDRGRVGLCLPASALASPAALDRLGPVLERLSRRDAPLFVHPGPAAQGSWLPALTEYVAGLSTAWHAWTLHGRAEHPRLRVLFAALAGLGPLHAERLAARGHARQAAAVEGDSCTFLDTSSYGPLALAAVARVVGAERLVHGSDLPYARPLRPDQADAGLSLLATAPAALLHGALPVAA